MDRDIDIIDISFIQIVTVYSESIRKQATWDMNGNRK
jgi:hypothetical protein